MIKYKKIGVAIAIVVCMVLVPLYLVACGEGDVLSIEYASGTIVYRQGTRANEVLADLQVVAKYQSGKTKLVKATRLEIQRIDTSKLGSHDVEVRLGDVSMTIIVSIVGADVNWDSVVVGYEQASNIVEYNSNKKLELGSESSFVIGNQPFYVGNLNKWVYFPNVTVRDSSSGNYVVAREFVSHISISRLEDNGVWRSLDQVDINEDGRLWDFEGLVSVDASNGEFEWASGVQGAFRITQTPTGLSYANINNIMDGVISVDVTVVDGGYNAYDGVDISRVDNSEVWHFTQRDPRDMWNNFKSVNNIQVIEGLSAIIFQNNISLAITDLPSGMFDDRGQLVNGEAIYRHTVDRVEDKFEIVGNYFTLDVQNLPLVGDYSLYAESSLFEFGGGAGLDPNDTYLNSNEFLVAHEGGKVIVSNLSSIGNAKRSADSSGFGGLVFVLSRRNFLDLTLDNMILNSYMFAFNFQYQTTRRVVSNSKVYDSFNFVANFYDAGDTNYLINDEFKRSGGPLFVLMGDGVYNGDGERRIWMGYDDNGDYVQYNALDKDGNPVWDNTDTYAYIPRKDIVYVDEATQIENWISGTENWFNTFGMGLMGGMIQLLATVDKPVYDNSGKQASRIEKDSNNQDIRLFNMLSVVLPKTPVSDGDGYALEPYDWDNEPFVGGLRFVDNINDHNVVGDYDMGAADMWVNKDSYGKTVADYGKGNSILAMRGRGTSRESFGLLGNGGNVFAPAAGGRPLNANEKTQVFGGDYLSIWTQSILAISITFKYASSL